MRLIDSHAHLDQVPNIEMEIENARKAGIVAILAVGSDEKSNEEILKIASRHENFVFPCLGLHPCNLRADLENMVSFIEANIEDCVAIGEVGLDFKIEKARDLQFQAFKSVLDLAVEFDKPVAVHSRWAWQETFELVRQAGVKRAVFHWYAGPIETLRGLLSFGCYVSATPAAAYSEEHRLALKEVPLDRIMLETDSPVKYRGVTASPSYVTKTLRAVAGIKGIDEKKVADETTKNVIKLFNLKL